MRSMLIELGFEELPARFITPALNQLQQGITDILEKNFLEHGEVQVFSTPRRLTVQVMDLIAQQPDRKLDVKGPPKKIAIDEQGDLTKAGRGFIRSQGVAEDQITIKELKGVEYLYVEKEIPGQNTIGLLPGLLREVIQNLNFPKNMRWGEYDLRFARPLRWILALYGSDIIPFSVGPVTSNRVTYGHRQLGAGELQINEPSQYLTILNENYVIAERSKRQELVRQQITEFALTHKVVVEEDERLLNENTDLVEYPMVFSGEFASDYLEVPSEVLITSMKEHQKYFPVKSSDGELLPQFIGVRNGVGNHLDNVVKGNEKVLEARLADALFFYNEDRQVGLKDNLAKLKGVVFQEGLGTVYDKTTRLEKLAPAIAGKLGLQEYQTVVGRTARLAKADLVTNMVVEFPELQGIMGERYALLDGEDELVCKGIGEHYKPRFAQDEVPSNIPGTIVSIADKLDTLVGYFALNRIPTGSQDPFALRRQAQGIVQILLANEYSISLAELISLTADGFSEIEFSQGKELSEFMLARLRVHLLDQDYHYDTVDAVLAASDDRIFELQEKVRILDNFRENPLFQDLYMTYERVANLAVKASGKVIQSEAMTSADLDFASKVEQQEQVIDSLLEQGLYGDVLEHLAKMRPTVDQYFEAVMIMDQDPIIRENRLNLLVKVAELFRAYADFRIIVETV